MRWQPSSKQTSYDDLLMIGNEISITYPLRISVQESSLRQKRIIADYMTQMLNTLTIRIPLDNHD